jgi:hypothetical protein
VYQALARRCRTSLVPVQPLADADENRARFTTEQLLATSTPSAADHAGLQPLVALKREER